MQWPGEQLILRLWETLAEKGIGGLLAPWQTKRVSKAQLEARCAELVALAQAEKLAEDIRSGTKYLERFPVQATAVPAISNAIEPTVGTYLPLPEIVQIVAAQTLQDAVRREVNTSLAITQAVAELENDSANPPNEKIDDDWLFRWRDFASGTSAEYMQQLWGRVLAGELKSPGSFTMRCLDFLRSLSQDEAKQIERLSPFVIQGFIWRGADSILNSSGLPFQSLLSLEHLGILSGVASLAVGGITYDAITQPQGTGVQFASFFESHGKAIIARSGDTPRKINIPIIAVTSLGMQIFSLGRFDPHIGYLTEFGQYLLRLGFTVSIADCRRHSSNQVFVSNEIPIATGK